MPFTPPPAAPNINDPATFAARASAWVAYEAGTLIPELNSLSLSYGPGSPFCSVGGTADAITLTSGLNLATLVDGQLVRFRPTAANTGATTLNLDARGARAVVDSSGNALTGGFLASGVEYWAVYRSADNHFRAWPVVGAGSSGGPALCSVGGTANALTLTSGRSISVLSNGQEILFYASAANTGATTIALDSVAAKAAVTARGTALPADYIRVGTASDRILTRGIYNSALDSFILYRLPEYYFSSPNGMVRFENGLMICWRTSFNSSSSGVTWTYSHSFAGSGIVPTIQMQAEPSSAVARFTTLLGPTTSAVTVYGWTDAGAGSGPGCHPLAVGFWF